VCVCTAHVGASPGPFLDSIVGGDDKGAVVTAVMVAVLLVLFFLTLLLFLLVMVATVVAVVVVVVMAVVVVVVVVVLRLLSMSCGASGKGRSMLARGVGNANSAAKTGATVHTSGSMELKRFQSNSRTKAPAANADRKWNKMPKVSRSLYVRACVYV
jgi:ABC-type multidrug transport system fused ATPase/permease subunit